ncbi:uncharacterized protein K441DRAFT_638462 [Cenococcum geophilum 1.58]|uniref:uncharacterized protein n=1 Tax=Cenococcum geophilum 1.58 TaxID=794803 RepID=UPI00358F229C|nr:hypothetical protein K441DRAFT_638462 [Cenococcum geophilum 1.58]
MPRLGHKKSRNGCAQCKTRHVKCDEKRPCSGCSRHGVRCSLVTWGSGDIALLDSQASQSGNGTSRNSGPLKGSGNGSSRRELSENQTPIPLLVKSNFSQTPEDGPKVSSSPDPFPYFARFVNESESNETHTWIRDLELMHQWTTSTYQTLTSLEEVRQIWKLTIPKMAFAHTYLMHEILALSASHLAYLQPDHRHAYFMLATHHQNIAINIMRMELSSITSENCHALFVTSSLVALTAFSSPDSVNPATPIDDLVDIFLLMRGMHGILKSAFEMIKEGPLGSILDSGPAPPPTSLLLMLLSRLGELSTLLTTREPDRDVRELCSVAISNFMETTALGITHTDDRELRVAFIWPIGVSMGFISLLRQRNGVALAILAHYCIILHTAEHNATRKNWFLSGWGSRIVESITSTVDPIWQDSVRWPMECIAGSKQ